MEESISIDPHAIRVGRIVRVPVYSDKSPDKTFHRRAVVATINSEQGTCSVLWETSALCSKANRYIVTPNFFGMSCDTGEDEISIENVYEIRKDEFDFFNTGYSSELSADELKAHGDYLFAALRDAASAVGYYEVALMKISKVEVGGMIVVNSSGKPLVAEVDCIDGHNIDVTYPDFREGTVSIGKALIGIHGDEKVRSTQIRILLNLARCFAMLIEMESTLSLSNTQAYRKASILACTLSLSCLSCQQACDDSASLEVKARYIRARVYLDCGKFKHSKRDLRTILKGYSNHKSAKSLMDEMEQRILRKKKADKNLAKNVCQWINRVTNGETGEDESDSVEECDSAVESTKDSVYKQARTFFHTGTLHGNIICLLIILLAFYIMKE